MKRLFGIYSLLHCTQDSPLSRKVPKAIEAGGNGSTFTCMYHGPTICRSLSKLDDIRVIRDFPEVFTGTILLGLPLSSVPRHVVNRMLFPSGSSKLSIVQKKEWKTLESSTEIRSFLGLAGYYQKFIENFSKIAKPLTLLTQNNKTYVWGDKQDEAFRILKEKLCTMLSVSTPRWGGGGEPPGRLVSIVMHLKTRFWERADAGGQVLAYASRPIEESMMKNYTTHDWNWVAVVFALKSGRHYIYWDEKSVFTLNTRVSVTYLTRKNLNMRQRRMDRALSVYDSMAWVSYLRLRFWKRRAKLPRISKPQLKVRRIRKTFGNEDDGEIYFFDRIWIPSVGGVRKLIMDEAHTTRYSVHPGADKMYYDLRDLYWWPGIKRDIAELTKSAHFLPIRKDYKTEKLANIYTNEIVGGMVCRWVSIFRYPLMVDVRHIMAAFQKVLGTRLDMSTTYHPQTANGQWSILIQTLKDCFSRLYYGLW
ncbi:putative reverse transcriptase domain-containing protein [Tanacetum coccineum]